MPSGLPQTGEPSYTGMIKKEDGKIDWNQNALSIEAKIRAYYPEPGAWCLEKELPLRILQANVFSQQDYFALDEDFKNVFDKAVNGTVLNYRKDKGIFIKTGDDILCVQVLQRQGKKAMNYKDFMNGARDFTGTVLQ